MYLSYYQSQSASPSILEYASKSVMRGILGNEMQGFSLLSCDLFSGLCRYLNDGNYSECIMHTEQLVGRIGKNV